MVEDASSVIHKGKYRMAGDIGGLVGCNEGKHFGPKGRAPAFGPTLPQGLGASVPGPAGACLSATPGRITHRRNAAFGGGRVWGIIGDPHIDNEVLLTDIP